MRLRCQCIVVALALAHLICVVAKDYAWAKPRSSQTGWVEQHEVLNRVAKSYRKASRGLELVWYGDSVVERMRGSVIGKPKFPEYVDVYFRHWPGGFRSALFGISGDTTAHLMWRILSGQTPRGLNATVAVVQIGTNDLSHTPAKVEVTPDIELQIAERTQMIVQRLLYEDKRMKVVLMALLPRGKCCGQHGIDREVNYKQPGRFTPHVKAINVKLEQWASLHKRVAFVDCGHLFLDKEGYIDGRMMTDALHPSPEGTEMMLERCLAPVVLPWLLRARNFTLPPLFNLESVSQHGAKTDADSQHSAAYWRSHKDDSEAVVEYEDLDGVGAGEAMGGGEPPPAEDAPKLVLQTGDGSEPKEQGDEGEGASQTGEGSVPKERENEGEGASQTGDGSAPEERENEGNGGQVESNELGSSNVGDEAQLGAEGGSGGSSGDAPPAMQFVSDAPPSQPADNSNDALRHSDDDVLIWR